MGQVSFILGAGFSVPAGIPIVKTISDYFVRKPLFEKVYCYSSTEWQWREFGNNPRIEGAPYSNDHVVISCFVEQLIEDYIRTTGNTILNYEDFYQWMWEIVDNKGSLKEVGERVKQKIAKHFIGYDGVLVDSVYNKNIASCIYHLITNLLVVRKPISELIGYYIPYVKAIAQIEDKVSVFTLNHDTLLEALLAKSSIEFANGFSMEESTLVGDDKEHLPIFSNEFNSRVNIFKLHGAVNQYKYIYFEDANRHKGYDYFITNSYHSKHYAQDVDANGNVIQGFNWDIVPQFVTGKNKLQLIKGDKMYSALYDQFETLLPKSEKLIIVGYSYGDAHINEVIEKSIMTIPKIVNVNPSTKLPFQHNNLVEIDPTKDGWENLLQ